MERFKLDKEVVMVLLLILLEFTRDSFAVRDEFQKNVSVQKKEFYNTSQNDTFQAFERPFCIIVTAGNTSNLFKQVVDSIRFSESTEQVLKVLDNQKKFDIQFQEVDKNLIRKSNRMFQSVERK